MKPMTMPRLLSVFPILLESGSLGTYQPHTAGHVSPRSQVRAQVAVVQKQGAAVIPAIVEAVHQTAHHVEGADQ